MAKKGKVRENVRMNSSADTGHFYIRSKNKREHPEKLEYRLFDPIIRKHVMYKEGKLK